MITKEQKVIHASYQGEPFIVRCHSDIKINIFNVTEIEFILSVEQIGLNENIWDITNLKN